LFLDVVSNNANYNEEFGCRLKQRFWLFLKFFQRNIIFRNIDFWSFQRPFFFKISFVDFNFGFFCILLFDLVSFFNGLVIYFKNSCIILTCFFSSKNLYSRHYTSRNQSKFFGKNNIILFNRDDFWSIFRWNFDKRKYFFSFLSSIFIKFTKFFFCFEISLKSF
jgi:hypothetical protein